MASPCVGFDHSNAKIQFTTPPLVSDYFIILPSDAAVSWAVVQPCWPGGISGAGQPAQRSVHLGQSSDPPALLQPPPSPGAPRYFFFFFKHHLTEEEVFEVMKYFQSGKTPELESIPVEVYQTFVDVLIDTLFACFNYSHKNGRLPGTQ